MFLVLHLFQQLISYLMPHKISYHVSKFNNLVSFLFGTHSLNYALNHTWNWVHGWVLESLFHMWTSLFPTVYPFQYLLTKFSKFSSSRCWNIYPLVTNIFSMLPSNYFSFLLLFFADIFLIFWSSILANVSGDFLAQALSCPASSLQYFCPCFHQFNKIIFNR